MTSPVLQAAAEVGTQDPDQFRNALESAYLGNRSLVDEVLDSGLVEETPFLQSLCRQLGLAWHDHVRPDSADTPQLRELCSAQIGLFQGDPALLVPDCLVEFDGLV
ncbi:MAG: hypothetical protein AAGJ31_16340 [Verrucomicrobiota bacterium]